MMSKQAAKSAGRNRRRPSRGRAPVVSARRRLLIPLAIGSIGLVAIIVVVAIMAGGASSNSAALTNAAALNPAPRLLAVGTKAPDFDLTTVGGQRYSLSRERGHPVLVEFFAVWCPHCQREAPILHQIDAAYGPKGLRTLAILANPYGRNYDLSNGTDLTPASRADVTWFEKTFSVTHPTLIDPTFGTVNRYGAGSYPTMYVIDGSGVVRYAIHTEAPYGDLAAAVAAAMTAH